MIALKRYALCLALLFSLHTQPTLALDNVDCDIGEITLPAWDFPASSLVEFLETLGLGLDGHTLAFLLVFLHLE